ncbi:hypothetical protein WR25_10810 [Diploscapter pachys]|uniref:ZP domain-containing protein n=1 Tax=Diploscapter pachys TaxID=2018661 RepID=A0A2A2JBI7_9BILA|nr:hypothetical protein WR25_10810 [Diploscapter pachys]
MCSSEGITASIDFDGNFNGKIYSLDYATVPDCLYYNNVDTDTVLFSIPAHRCGTKLSRTTRNMIDQMENRVYVQMDKNMQTASDKQFSFVCQLANANNQSSSSGNDIRRHPVSPISQSDSYISPPQSPIVPQKVQMSPPLPQEPVKAYQQSPTVPRVNAFSTDSHFGNWPIPGSRPYDPSMKPIAPYPIGPKPKKIEPSVNPIGFSHAYPISNSIHLEPVIPKQVGHPLPPPNPFLSNSIDSNPKFDKYPAAPQISQVQIRPYVGMGAESAPAYPTQIPAHLWSQPVNVDEKDKAKSSDSDKPVEKSEEKPKHKKAETFKEEPPVVEAPFSSDIENKKIGKDDPSSQSVLVTTQEHMVPPSEMTLEIQSGEGPYSAPVQNPVKIGDNISLVVKAKSQMTGSKDFDMFVHSCFATDGPGTTKTYLIDENGCVMRPEIIVSPLLRTKDPSGMMYYYFRVQAFKFPGPDDVYFSCSIDLTPLRKTQDICPTDSTNSSKRGKREAADKMLRLFDNVRVELAEEFDKERRAMESDSSLHCLPSTLFRLFALSVCALIVAFTISSFTAIYLYYQLSMLKARK